MSNQIVITSGAKVRNLDGVLTGSTGVVSSVPLGAANGVATLDSGGKVPVSQLPASVVTYLGTWNAATNTPTLTNGVGDAGDMYICNVAGTVNFGAGPITFAVGDWVLYGSGTWQKSSGQNGTVTSVAASINGNAIGITGSPITTAGTLAFAFAGTNSQYVNGAGNLTTFPTLISSIGLSMPSAFSVSNSPLTANGTISVTAAGNANQYIRGDGTLAAYTPNSGGGGSSLVYYFNGGVASSVAGYEQMSTTANTGASADFSVASDGYIASFLTDAGSPNQLNIPAGNWNFEIYMSASSSGGNPNFYVELYKYNGSTFTLISSNSANPEGITNGTSVDLYTTALTVPATTLLATDRLAVRVYVSVSGRTITMHTQDSNLSEVITTFSTGITALNGLTTQVQYFQTGTSGTDFNISSLTDTHTFNLPTASSTKRGALSSSDWSTFNSKEPAIAAGTTSQYWRGDKTWQTLNTTAVAEGTNLYFTNARAIASTLTGYVSGAGTISSTDSILSAIQKLNGNIGALTTGVSSVFGRTGAVTAQSGDYTTTLVTEGTNLYYTDARARGALSFTAGSGAYNSTTGVITIPTNNNQITNGANYITLTSLSATTPLSYNNTTGAFSISQASTSTNGYLSSTDWNTFNNKQSALTFGNLASNDTSVLTISGGTGAVIGTGATITINNASATNAGIVSTGTQTFAGNKTFTGLVTTYGHNINKDATTGYGLNIQSMGSLSIAGTGYVSLTSNSTSALNIYYNGVTNSATLSGASLTAGRTFTFPDSSGTLALTSDLSSYVPTSRTLTINGTAYDLSANRSWSVGTVTSVAALTLGTSGTDLNSTVANGTTTPVITLNVPDASATARGVVSTGTQTFGGAKTFTFPVTAAGFTALGSTSSLIFSYQPNTLLQHSITGATYSSSTPSANTLEFSVANSSGGSVKALILDGTGAGKFANYVSILNGIGTNQIYLPIGGDVYGTIQTNSDNSYSLGYANSIGTLGTPVLSWLGNGSVGIGTTQPLTTFHVIGTGKFSSSVTAASGLYNGYTSGLPPTTGSATRGGLRLNNASNIAFDFGTVAAGQAWIQISDANNYASNFALLLNPNGGNVGIGTTSPGGILDVRLNQNAQSNVYFRNTDNTNSSSRMYLNLVAGNTSAGLAVLAGGSGTGDFYIGGNNGGNTYFQPYLGGGVTMTLTSGGNVGIGTTNPTYQFVVSKSGATGLEIDPDNGTPGKVGIYAYSRSGAAYKPLHFEASQYEFTNGNVLIGTTTDNGNKLQVNGSANIGTTTSAGTLTLGSAAGYYGLNIYATNTSSQSYGFLLNAGTNSSDYAMYVRNAAQGSPFIYIRGDGYLYSASAWSGSDKRLKENITDLDNGLYKILNLKPRKFDFINSFKNQYGFVAQELQEVIPDAVSIFDEENKMLAIKMDFIIPHLVKAIQEQNQLIEDLKSRLDKAGL